MATELSLFDERVTATSRERARQELRQIYLELEYETRRAETLRKRAGRSSDLSFKADAAETVVAALRARAAQLRRAAGRLAPAA